MYRKPDKRGMMVGSYFKFLWKPDKREKRTGPYLKFLTTINEEDLQKGEDGMGLSEIPNKTRG